MLACRYVEENGSAAMLATKRLAGVTPEVKLSEHVKCTPPPSTNKAAHSGCETKMSQEVQNRGISDPTKGTYVVFTLAVSGTWTGTGTGTYIMQRPFTLAVSGARTEHLKAIEISLKHTT